MEKVLANISIPSKNISLSLSVPSSESNTTLLSNLIKQIEVYRQVSYGTDDYTKLSLEDIKSSLEGMKYGVPSLEEDSYMCMRNDIIDQCIYKLSALL